jgi:hypothetical protein
LRAEVFTTEAEMPIRRIHSDATHRSAERSFPQTVPSARVSHQVVSPARARGKPFKDRFLELVLTATITNKARVGRSTLKRPCGFMTNGPGSAPVHLHIRIPP